MSCSVLIVDDSPILRMAIRKAAMIAGVPAEQIRQAANGQEALEALASGGTDLVLLDLHMPVMDGEQFVRAWSARPDLRQITVCIVSTESDQERIARLRALGVKDYLPKPFEPEALCRLIKRVAGVRA